MIWQAVIFGPDDTPWVPLILSIIIDDMTCFYL